MNATETLIQMDKSHQERLAAIRARFHAGNDGARLASEPATKNKEFETP